MPRALSQHTGAIRVLHVDDEPAFADTARAYLEREDDRLTVTTASSASEGLEHLAEAPVDCIVSDYQMPGMDGLTFLEAVREDHPDLPFVLFTGQGSEAAASDAISAGATDYLRKGSGTDQYELLANRVRNVVEQSRAKQQVRDVETRYSALFENLGEPAVEVTFEGDTAVVETVNERFETVFGVEASAIVGDPLDAEITPEDERDSARELNRRSKVGESIEQEVQRRTADGPRWFLLRTVSFPVGEERRAYAIYVDITERKDREQKLGTRATAMEASIDGMAILDADDEYVFVNQAHADAYRYDGPSAFLGETWRMCYDDDELERFEEEVIPAMREEGRWRGEAVGTRKDGTTFPQELSLTATGEGGIICVVRDITDRKKRERALERLHDATRGLMTATSTEEIGTLASETATRVLGLSMNGVHLHDAEAGHLVPVAWSDGVEAVLDGPPPALPVADSLAGRAFRSGDAERHEDVGEADGFDGDTPFGSELHVPLGDHGVFILSSTETADFDTADETLARVLAANIEAALDRVEQRRELQRERDRLDEFASVVSHDLKNPLRVARGRLDLATEECDSDHLDVVGDAHDRMETLIDDLLTLARDGERVEEMRSVALGTTVETCWRRVETAEATLVAGTDRSIRADPNRLKQFLENLLRNAVDHGRSDGTITVGELEDGFYVADEGPGIAPDERERVFEAGYSTSDRGTGLGLNIVGTIAEAHGWDISVTDSESGGARFEITDVTMADE